MTDDPVTLQGLVCPPPIQVRDRIVMGHGSGGKLSHDLIAKKFLPAFDNAILRAGDDAGVVTLTRPGQRMAVTTDSHVVWPLFFPGGDIGRLAVCGTVNDIAMMGAEAQYLTAGFILEEGFELDTLERIIDSMKIAADEAGVSIIAGDTKVVQRGKADGVYINTTGVGAIPDSVEIGGAQAKPGDVVILSGPIGDHGIAVLSARGELDFEADIRSDVAPLNHLVEAMLSVSDELHVLRDPTRGGVATTLNEIARQSNVGITLDEPAIPVRPAVRAACEMLGFDPLYVANEGKLIAIVERAEADRVLDVMHSTRYGEAAVIVGEVQAGPKNRVLMKTAIGSHRLVDVLMGELLPRIC